jgi:hypothetical protein
MLSPKAREHGRETRISITPQGDPNACAGQRPTRDFGRSSAVSRLVEQMANTFRSRRYCRATQSFATTSPHANNLLVEDQATDCSNAAASGQTESWFDWRSCGPARVAQSDRKQISPIALDDQTSIAPAWTDCPAQPSKTAVLSETLAGGVWQPACAGLDQSLSRRGSQDLCLSHLEFAHACLHANDCHRQKLRNSPETLPPDLEIPWSEPTVHSWHLTAI